MLRQVAYHFNLKQGNRPPGEAHLPERQAEVNEHHPEVGREVRSQEMPLECAIKEPDLRLGRDQLQVDRPRVVHLRPLGLGRKNQADLPIGTNITTKTKLKRADL